MILAQASGCGRHDSTDWVWTALPKYCAGFMSREKIKPLPLSQENARLLRLVVCCSDSTNHMLLSREVQKVWYGLTAAVIISIGIVNVV